MGVHHHRIRVVITEKQSCHLATMSLDDSYVDMFNLIYCSRKNNISLKPGWKK